MFKIICTISEKYKHTNTHVGRAKGEWKQERKYTI